MALVATAALLSTESASADITVLRGTVNYRESMALPPNAFVLVQLLDVSLPDAPARVIAEDRIRGATGGPIPYRLSFDRQQINLDHSYALQARIFDGDRLLFINASHHAVFAGGRNSTRILVRRIEATAAHTVSIVGKWLAEDILGGGVIDRLQTILEIAPDGVVTGSGGCNRFRGKAIIDGERISFRQLTSTKMSCAPAAMQQEDKFQQALEATRRFRVDTQEHRLILLDDGDKRVALFAEVSA
ncbi:YbaY family lipoprotein [Bradyrhizobium australiense]|uniref:META domain-containing protein n=1 Tax=Bradyrhizobium australiense TaxID=2721161 RepID=A0A7Y4GMB2_9BRAD|nr:YbaY family lipoprotein [Bradyrhizobium australiense]NOJ38425.1 META domain-containing protein [Bradyrhizobium australiense]